MNIPFKENIGPMQLQKVDQTTIYEQSKEGEKKRMNGNRVENF